MVSGGNGTHHPRDSTHTATRRSSRAGYYGASGRSSRPDPRDKTANPRARPRGRRIAVPRHRIFRTRREPAAAPSPQADAHGMEEHRYQCINNEYGHLARRPAAPACASCAGRPSTRLHCKRTRRLRRRSPDRPRRRPGRHGPTGSVFSGVFWARDVATRTVNANDVSSAPSFSQSPSQDTTATSAAGGAPWRGPTRPGFAAQPTTKPSSSACQSRGRPRPNLYNKLTARANAGRVVHWTTGHARGQRIRMITTASSAEQSTAAAPPRRVPLAEEFAAVGHRWIAMLNATHKLQQRREARRCATCSGSAASAGDMGAIIDGELLVGQVDQQRR